MIIVSLSCRGHLWAEVPQDFELFEGFSEKKYLGMVDEIDQMHVKGPRTYYRAQLAKEERFLGSGIDPIMVIVHHNNVDIIVGFLNEGVVRLNFSRATGVWSPRTTFLLDSQVHISESGRTCPSLLDERLTDD